MKLTSSKSRRWPRLFRGWETKDKSTYMSDTADDMSSTSAGNSRSHLSGFDSEDFTLIEDSAADMMMMSSVRCLSNTTTSADSKLQLNSSIIDAEETNRMQPMMARLDALQIQQELYGMNHPDVIFSLKHLGSILGRLEASWEVSGLLWTTWVRLGTSWGHLGASWGVLRTFWGVFGAFWGVLGRLRCVFGALWGAWLRFINYTIKLQ